jgi:hypothetical protein
VTHVIHTVECKIHAQADVSHTATCGGWNKAVMTTTRSWKDEEDPGEAHRSYGGTKANRSGLEKTKAKNHRKTILGVTARGGTWPNKADQARRSGSKVVEWQHHRLGDKKEGVGDEEGKGNGRSREEESKVYPSPRKYRIEAEVKPL